MPRLVLVAIALFAAHRLGIAFFDPAQGISRIWPASGVAVAILVLSRRPEWPALLAVVFGAASVGSVVAGIPPWIAAGFAAANVVECSIAAAVVHAVSGERRPFAGVRDMLALIGGGAFSVAVSALLGASITSSGGAPAFATAFRTWWTADYLGILVVAPLVVDWARAPRDPTSEREGGNLELVGFAVAWSAAAGLAFLRPHAPGDWNADPYMLLPLLAWAALRFGPREVTTALAVLASAAVVGTARGVGAFGGEPGGPTESLVSAQLYLGITAISALLLVASQTERRAAEMAAREGQARLRALSDNLPDGMVYQVVREPDGKMRFVYVSRGVERVHGLDVDAVLRDPSLLYEQIEPADRAMVAEAEAASVRTLQPFRVVVRSRVADGDVRSLLLSSSPRRLPDGRILWDGIETDLTDLRRAEDESLRTAERLNMALDAVRMGTWEWDIASGRVYWSDRVEDIFDLPPGTFAPTYAAVVEVIHPEDRPRVQDAIDRTIRGDTEYYDVEHRVPGRDGTMRWLAGKGRLYRDPDGRATRIAGTIVDVTERNTALDAVKHSEERLRQAQKLESLGTLAGGIAHDFNNILGAIIARAELSRFDLGNEAQLKENLDQILTASSRATSLIQKILSFSRNQVQQRAKIAMGGVVNEALGLLRATLPATIAIERAVDEALPPVFADGTQLHQVVMNLCTNAAHAMNNRGTLGVRVGRYSLAEGTPEPRPDLPPGEYACLTVTDTGHGMEPETLGRIFDPFFTTKGPGGGTGLGLAVVFGIVKDHDGYVAVRSEPGNGATFTVYLPLVVSEPHVEKAKRKVPVRGQGEFVLFVDDEQALCDVGGHLLSRAGYRAEAFRNAPEALAVFEREPGKFAAVITDLTMPGMTGIELAERIATVAPSVPVIITSGFVDGDAAEAIARLGIQVVQKPYGYDALTSAVAGAIEGSRPREVTQATG